MTVQPSAPGPKRTARSVAETLADRPIYRRLHAITAAVALPFLLKELRRQSASSAAALLMDEASAGMKFLRDQSRQAPTEAGIPVQTPDDDLIRTLAGSLTDHVLRRRNAADVGPANTALAQELADELGVSLWSTLLDHAAIRGQGQRLRPVDLLPAWSQRHDDAGSALGQLVADMQRFGLEPGALLEITHDSLGQLLEDAPADGLLTLPLGLLLDRSETTRFLSEQDIQRAQRRAFLVEQPTDSAAVPTSQIPGL